MLREVVPSVGGPVQRDAVGHDDVHHQLADGQWDQGKAAPDAPVQTKLGLVVEGGASLQPFQGVLAEVLAQLLDLDAVVVELDGVEARLVEVGQDGEHHPGLHVEGPQALVAVANGGVDELDLVAHEAPWRVWGRGRLIRRAGRRSRQLRRSSAPRYHSGRSPTHLSG